jgi:hypothetical protein
MCIVDPFSFCRSHQMGPIGPETGSVSCYALFLIPSEFPFQVTIIPLPPKSPSLLNSAYQYCRFLSPLRSSEVCATVWLVQLIPRVYVAHLHPTSHPRTKYTVPNPEFPIFMTVALFARYKARVKCVYSTPNRRVIPRPLYFRLNNNTMTLPFANHGVRFTRHSSLPALITCRPWSDHTFGPR